MIMIGIITKSSTAKTALTHGATSYHQASNNLCGLVITLTKIMYKAVIVWKIARMRWKSTMDFASSFMFDPSTFSQMNKSTINGTKNVIKMPVRICWLSRKSVLLLFLRFGTLRNTFCSN